MYIDIMTIKDYDHVMELWLHTKGMGLNHIDDSREGIERFLDRNPSTCFVARDNERVVGVIMAGHDGRRGYIYHTAVAEDMRKQGIGKSLLDACMISLEQEGIHKCALVVFEKNEIGNTFWEREGFIRRDDLVYRNKSVTDLKRMDT